MGFFKKVKGFFGRVWGGIKKGWSKAKDVLRKVITPIYDKAKPLINMIPGAGAVAGVIDKVLPVVNNLSDDSGEAIKQGIKYAYDKFGGLKAPGV